MAQSALPISDGPPLLDREAPTDHVYAPPAKQEDEATPWAPSEVGRKHGVGALLALPAAVLVGVVTIGVMILAESTWVGVVGFGVATLITLVGAARGVMSVARQVRANRYESGGFIGVVVFFGVIGNGFMALVGALMTLMSTSAFSRGRQLRRFGRILLPPVSPGAAWAEEPMSVSVDPSAKEGLAAQWRENGRTEHASVAAFARLTLDLMALGAPPSLIEASQRDALDEVRHTELCFSLARALDGKSESPGAFPAASRARTLPPTRPLALSALAVDSLIDGALHEGVSARVIARLAKRCEEPRIRAILKEIAADEGRHAAHGWDVVEWCLAEGGRPVAEALRGALRALPEGVHSDLPAAAEEGAWERWGIHGRALEAAELAGTRADLVRRVQRMIGAQGRGDAMSPTADHG